MPAKAAANRSSPGTIAFTATSRYRSWCGAFARHRGVDVSHLIEAALRGYAEALGHPAPPPRLASRLRGRTFGVKVRTARAG
jgi:hypothetical protein